MRDIAMTTIREYTGLTTGGCTVHADISRPALRDYQHLGFRVSIWGGAGWQGMDALEALAALDAWDVVRQRFETEADAAASIESLAPVAWVGAV